MFIKSYIFNWIIQTEFNIYDRSLYYFFIIRVVSVNRGLDVVGTFKNSTYYYFYNPDEIRKNGNLFYRHNIFLALKIFSSSCHYRRHNHRHLRRGH